MPPTGEGWEGRGKKLQAVRVREGERPRNFIGDGRDWDGSKQPRGPIQFGAPCSPFPHDREGGRDSISSFVRPSFPFPFWHEGDIQRAKWRSREASGARGAANLAMAICLKKGLTRSRSAAAEREGGKDDGGGGSAYIARNWQRQQNGMVLAKTPSSNGARSTDNATFAASKGIVRP